MSEPTNTDHDGRPVPPDEPADKAILVWHVSPHTGDPAYDVFVERSWQRMLEYVGSNLDYWLERHDEGQLRRGVTLTFKLADTTVGEYAELQDQM